MTKSYPHKVMKCCCLLLLVLGNTAYGYTQVVLASNKVHYSSSAKPQTAPESLVRLKNAIEDIKRKFNIQIAYKEGILAGKYVSLAVVYSVLPTLSKETYLPANIPSL